MFVKCFDFTGSQIGEVFVRAVRRQIFFDGRAMISPAGKHMARQYCGKNSVAVTHGLVDGSSVNVRPVRKFRKAMAALNIHRMFFPVRQRVNPQGTFEVAVKVAVVVEAAVDGDFGNRLAGIFQAVTGDEYTQAYQIL